MPQLKIAVQSRNFRLPLKLALAKAAQLGASGVEIDARAELKPADMSRTAVRQFRKLLDDLGLRVAALGFQTRSGYNVAEKLDQRVAATKEAMKLAHDLGAAVVVNQIGRVPAKPEGREWTLLVEVLADLGRFGQHVGAWLAAETGSESGADLARLIAALPAGSLGVNLDPGNLIINGFSPLEAIDELGPSIVHVHAKDAVRDLAQGRGVEVPLGRGAADFPALLGALEEHGYRGYFTVERQRSEDPERESALAIQYLRSL